MRCSIASTTPAVGDQLRVELGLGAEPLGLAQQLAGQHRDAGGAIAHLIVLRLRALDEDLCRRVIDEERLENRGTVVGDDDLAIAGLDLVVSGRGEKRSEENQPQRSGRSRSNDSLLERHKAVLLPSYPFPWDPKKCGQHR